MPDFWCWHGAIFSKELFLILILWSYGECWCTVLSLHKHIIKLYTGSKSMMIWDWMSIPTLLLLVWWIDKMSQHFFLLKHTYFLVLLHCSILKHDFKFIKPSWCKNVLVWSYGECRCSVFALHKYIVKLWTVFKWTI